VVNATFSSLTLQLREKGAQRILGARYGLNGLLKSEFYELHSQPEELLRKIADVPGMALGTTRKKPEGNDLLMVFETFRKMDVRYFFFIGGDDTANAANIIQKEAASVNYELSCIHVAKTIDNDLEGHDRTPGYGSSALFINSAISGIDMDNRALPGVHIIVTMGKNCGFLSAASTLSKKSDSDAPHKVYLPERDFSVDGFISDVHDTFSKFGRAVMVVSEGVGVRNGNGKVVELLSYLKKTQGDGFGGITLSGTGALGDFLVEQVKQKLGIARARADTLGYSQRSFFNLRSNCDFFDAQLVGSDAVTYAMMDGNGGSVALLPLNGDGRRTTLVPLELVGGTKRGMPAKFISENSCGINLIEFQKYALPLVDFKVPELVELQPRVPSA